MVYKFMLLYYIATYIICFKVTSDGTSSQYQILMVAIYLVFSTVSRLLSVSGITGVSYSYSVFVKILVLSHRYGKNTLSVLNVGGIRYFQQ